MPNVEDDPEKTRLIRRAASESPKKSDPSIVDLAAASPSSGGPAAEESEMTRLIGAPRRTRSEPPVERTSGPDDPVVGWLVIVNGPGRGNACRLGYGQNSIGRERDERVCIDFGDETISRRKHCFVIYEPRERQYVLRPGDGANLTYLNGKMLSEPRPLKAADKIEIGQTTLRFMPLCGPNFEWHDQSQ